MVKGNENEKNFIYLKFYQIRAFVEEIQEIRNQNQFFNDEVVSMFEDYVINRTYQTSFIPKNIRGKIPVYKISISLFEYLEKLTSINAFDKEFMKEYIKKAIKQDEEFLDRLNNGEFDDLLSDYFKRIKLCKK